MKRCSRLRAVKTRMMDKNLEKKVEQAVKLLQVCYKAAGEPLEVAYSGGKEMK